MKRGQTEVSLGTILLVILGIVGVVVVGLFIYKAYDKGNEVTDALPGGFDVAVSSCQYTASLGNKASYCSSFKKITVSGKDQWVSCDYLEDTWEAEIKGNNAWTCSDNLIKTFCNQTRTTDTQNTEWNSTVVNGKRCDSVIKEGVDF